MNQIMRTIHFDILAPVYDRLIKSKRPREMLQLIDKYLREDTGYRILEVGGGTGRISQYFLGLGSGKKGSIYCKLEETRNEVIVLDPSVKMLARAEGKGFNKLIQAYAEDIPLDMNSVDIVIVSDSLHHWKNHQKGLEQIYRVLKPDGLLIIEEINPSRLVGKMIIFFEKVTLMGSRFFRAEKLEEICEDVGFEVLEVNLLKKPFYHLIARK